MGKYKQPFSKGLDELSRFFKGDGNHCKSAKRVHGDKSNICYIWVLIMALGVVFGAIHALNQGIVMDKIDKECSSKGLPHRTHLLICSGIAISLLCIWIQWHHCARCYGITGLQKILAIGLAFVFISTEVLRHCKASDADAENLVSNGGTTFAPSTIA